MERTNKKKRPEMILIKVSIGLLLCFTLYALILISMNVGIIIHNIDLTYNANRWCATNNEIYINNNLTLRCHADSLQDHYMINKTQPLKNFYISGINAISKNHLFTFTLSLTSGILIMILIVLPPKFPHKWNN